MTPFFKYFTITSISYLTARRIFYYPFIESKNDNKPILYSEYFIETILPLPTYMFTFPIAFYTDIILMEKYIRNIPINTYESLPLFPFTNSDYRLKKKYLN
jgi:hypothetical protein